MFSGKKCTLVFQPHLFTRTRDFANDFAEVLDLADEVYLLPIYPAREKPIEGVTSSMLSDKMTKAITKVVDKQEVLEILKRKESENQLEMLVTAGAGDIDTLVEPIRKIIENKK